jgi:hypothetical protein
MISRTELDARRWYIKEITALRTLVGAWLHFFAHQFGMGVVQAYHVFKVLRI